MKRRNILLGVLIAGCSFPAFADKAYVDSGGYADLAPQTDLSAYSGAPSSWKGTLTREEVAATLREALAARTLPVGDALDYPLAGMKTPPSAAALGAMPDTRLLGAAPSNGLTIDGYRFIGGEAGYVRDERAMRR